MRKSTFLALPVLFFTFLSHAETQKPLSLQLTECSVLYSNLGALNEENDKDHSQTEQLYVSSEKFLNAAYTHAKKVEGNNRRFIDLQLPVIMKKWAKHIASNFQDPNAQSQIAFCKGLEKTKI